MNTNLDKCNGRFDIVFAQYVQQTRRHFRLAIELEEQLISRANRRRVSGKIK